MTTDQRIDALTAATEATNQRVDKLAANVDALTVAVHKTNDRVDELTHELCNGVSHQLTEMRKDINVLTRRMDELPARLERQIRVAVARDQARAATALVERLEQEAQ